MDESRCGWPDAIRPTCKAPRERSADRDHLSRPDLASVGIGGRVVSDISHYDPFASVSADSAERLRLIAMARVGRVGSKSPLFIFPSSIDLKDVTMASTVGDFFWERLHAWGVRVVFGYPGDGITACWEP